MICIFFFLVTAVALVPIQITIPSQQSGGVAKTITIHAPSTALTAGIAGPQLQSILSSPAAAQTFALEVFSLLYIFVYFLVTLFMDENALPIFTFLF